MAVNNFPNQEFDNRTYSSVMRELGNSTKDLIHNEINLLVAEVKYASQKVGSHAGQMILFGFLAALSVLPFIAFLIIAIGNLLGDQYALSSLIVGVVHLAIGGPLAWRAWKKIKEEDLKLPHLMQSLEREKAVAQMKINDLKQAVKGERHESH